MHGTTVEERYNVELFFCLHPLGMSFHTHFELTVQRGVFSCPAFNWQASISHLEDMVANRKEKLDRLRMNLRACLSSMV